MAPSRGLAQETPSAVRLGEISVAGDGRGRVGTRSDGPFDPSGYDSSSRPGLNRGPERGTGPVRGYAAKVSATSTKTDTPLLETPQSVSIVTQDQVTAQGAQNLVETLRYTPGVFSENFGNGTFFEGFKIRGFDAQRYLDGLRLPMEPVTQFGAPRIEPYGLERIEVLKGPSSGLYGATDPGGFINMVSKRPLQTPHFEALTTFGSFGRKVGAFDFGGPIDQSGEFSYRLVGLGRLSDTQVNFVEDNKVFIAPSLSWQPSVDTKLTILSQYQLVDNSGLQAYVPAQVSLRGYGFPRIPYSRYIGEPGRDAVRVEQGSIGYAFEHRFNDVFQFRQNFRYSAASNNFQAVRSEGFAFPNIFRSFNYSVSETRNLTIDNQLQADFATGPLLHKALVGLDYFTIDSYGDTRGTGIAPINAYAPIYGSFIPPASLLPYLIRAKSAQDQLGIYAQDQIKFDRWVLTLTGRQDWVTTNIRSFGFFPTPGNYTREDSSITGRVGLTYLFDFGLAPYANYSTSFVPNAGVNLTGGTFKPTTGEGWEAGAKYQPFGLPLLLSAAYFEINQKDILSPNPLNPFFSTQTGAARVTGFELEARGNLTPELEIVGGYSNIDPKITKSVSGFVGNTLPYVPVDQGSLWAKYTWRDGWLAGFGIGGGVRYVGTLFGNEANTLKVPGYTLFDAGVSYDLSYLRPDLRGWHAQINATNLADKYYVASCFTGEPYCVMGTSRTVLGTLRYSWN